MLSSKEKRNQRKLNEFGRNARCELCGEQELSMLTKGKLMEEHHIAGKHDGDTITVCRNCHAKLTDDQLDWPDDVFNENRTSEMESVSFFLGLASILAFLAILCVKHATTLHDFVASVQGVSHT